MNIPSYTNLVFRVCKLRKDVDFLLSKYYSGSLGGWSLTGNAGTVAGTNFIGTTDSVSLVFKTNSIERFRILDTGNVGIGVTNPGFKLEVGGTSSVSDRKIGINGHQAIYMPDQTSFLNSFFLGQDSGTNISHSSGFDSWNLVGIGVRALKNNTTGFNNTAVGVITLELNTTGYYCTAVGTGALSKNTTGFENTAIGMSSMTNNTSGSENTAVGTSSLLSNTTGVQNVAFGTLALRANTTGIQNQAFGYRAMYNNTSGSLNLAFGYGSLASNTTGNGSVAIGYGSIPLSATGNYNTAVGHNSAPELIATGDAYNTIVGASSGIGLTTGVRNTIIGARITVSSSVSDSIFIGDGSGNIRIKFNSSGRMTLGVVPPEYADDAAAIVGGLTSGDIYKTGSVLKVVN